MHTHKFCQYLFFVSYPSKAFICLETLIETCWIFKLLILTHLTWGKYFKKDLSWCVCVGYAEVKYWVNLSLLDNGQWAQQNINWEVETCMTILGKFVHSVSSVEKFIFMLSPLPGLVKTGQRKMATGRVSEGS